MIKKTLKVFPFILYALGIYFLFQGKYIWSGCAIIASGVAGAFLRGIFSELIVLIGFLLISIAYDRKFLLFIASTIVIVGIYDLIQLYTSMKEMESDKAQKNQDTLQNRLREKNLLHRLFKKVLKIKS